VGRDMERDSARMALFRNSDSFRQAARGVEVRERLASLSARYPASSSTTDVYKGPQRASSLSCVSLQRTSSSNAAGSEFHHNSEALFKYGSQRYGAAGSLSLGRLNERELGTESSSPEEGTVSSSSDNWITLELDPSTPKPDAVPDTQPMLGKPRSGPLVEKQGKKGEQQRVRAERGSLRGLRGSFSSALHRSASEGRAQFFAMEPLPTPTEPVVEVDNGASTTLAQRTMQWLSGGNKHTRSSSARASLEQRNSSALQQIVTE
jgi:hypothetical protein